MPQYILAIDQSTTASKALLIDQSLRVVAQSSHPFEQHYPEPGWVEHDLNEVWETVQRAVADVLRGRSAGEIAAIGITNQRETTCFWDRATGQALGRAIVWQDRRTAEFCSKLKKSGKEAIFHKKTGLLLDPYFSGTKITWGLNHRKEVAAAAKEHRLCVGTIDSFLIYKLTGEHLTEPSNASRTLLFDIHKGTWSKELCRTLKVPHHILPEVRDSSGVFAKTCNDQKCLPAGIPVAGVLGDQQAALFGQGCFEPGSAKCTYGTGAFLLMNTGTRARVSRRRLLTTVAWSIGGKLTYALEGSLFIAGAAVQWLRDGLRLIESSAEIETLAAEVPDSAGVVFVPALAGLGAPHWDPNARGELTGLTRGTTRAHVARAVLEGIALQGVDILSAMQKDAGRKLRRLNVDGGASANNLLMQFQADVLGTKIVRPQFLDTTILGAAMAAGLGVGFWSTREEVLKTWRVEREFSPSMAAKLRAQKLQSWSHAIKKAKLR